MVAGGAAFADWSRLLAAGPALLAALIVTVAIIAASEELTFRGLLLVAMRGRYREGVAAAMTVVIFAVVHVLVGGGLSDLGQGISTILGGFLYYLTRRVSGGLLAPILVHATWNFTALSGSRSFFPQGYTGPLNGPRGSPFSSSMERLWQSPSFRHGLPAAWYNTRHAVSVRPGSCLWLPRRSPPIAATR